MNESGLVALSKPCVPTGASGGAGTPFDISYQSLWMLSTGFRAASFPFGIVQGFRTALPWSQCGTASNSSCSKPCAQHTAQAGLTALQGHFLAVTLAGTLLCSSCLFLGLQTAPSPAVLLTLALEMWNWDWFNPWCKLSSFLIGNTWHSWAHISQGPSSCLRSLASGWSPAWRPKVSPPDQKDVLQLLSLSGITSCH